MTAECTTETCQNWTEAYLCNQCTSDLQAWIDQIPALLTELPDTIAKTDHLKRSGGGSSHGKPGSQAPINLDALQISRNLESVSPNATNYAHDPHAAGIAWLIQDWVTKAERMISGPEETFIDHHANTERIRDIAPPMPTRKLLPWLREKAGITITSTDIRNWARRGKLHPAELEPSPTYHPHEVLHAWHTTKEQP